eukprot:560453-Ditylum_brightwellii.AAC.1
MANLLAFLDLPHGKSFDTSSIPEAIEEEIRLTLEEGWENGTKTRRKERMLIPSLSPMSVEKIYPTIILKSVQQSLFHLIWDGRGM